MIPWWLFGLTALLLVLLTYVAARGFVCNIRQIRHARNVAPLDGLDLAGATVTAVPPPKTWPGPEAITDPPTAAAYAYLADDRIVTHALVGELLVIAGGALLGVRIADVFDGGWEPIVLVLAGLAAGTFGTAVRLRATRHWEPIAARYRARYVALTAPQPVPPPEPPRRGGLLGLFRRR